LKTRKCGESKEKYYSVEDKVEYHHQHVL